MKSRTTGEDIYKEVLACVQKLKLEWKYLCGVTTVGAPSMIGSDVGAVTRIKNLLKSKNIADPLAVHCIIHVEILCSKTFEMPHVMDVVVKVVNFIRSRGLNHRQFKAFLEEIECPYDVIYDNSVRWLSRAKVLQRFVDLMTEIEIFLMEKKWRYLNCAILTGSGI